MIFAEWQYNLEGRSISSGYHLPQSYPLPLRKTDRVYDLAAGGAIVTVKPIYRQGQFIFQDEKGAITSAWHANIGAAANQGHGLFGTFLMNPHAGGAAVKQFRAGNAAVGEPEFVAVPKYLDFTQLGLAAPAEYWTVEDSGDARLDDGRGANLLVGKLSAPIDPGPGAAVPRSGQVAYAVDGWRLTNDLAQVVNAYPVGTLISAVGKHLESGLEIWSVELYEQPQLTTVPIA